MTNNPEYSGTENLYYIIIKKCLVGLFLSLCTLSASTDTNQNLDDVFENENESPKRQFYKNPPFFKDSKDSSEITDFLVTATPAYTWLLYEFSQAFTALSPTQFAGGLMAGYLVADLFSGLAHLTTDSWDPEIFPESLAKVFRGAQQHHDNPTDVLHEGVWKNNKKYHIAGYAFLGATTLLRLYGFGFASEILDVAIAMNIWTGWFHACGHGAYQDSTLVTTLQKSGLLISRNGHGKHHKPPFDRNFTVISGLTNPLLNKACEAGRWLKGCAGSAFSYAFS